MLKLLIFDWDDVITLGSKEGYFRCYHEALTQVGVHLETEQERREIVENWGKPYREELRYLLRSSPELLDQACEIYQREKHVKNTFISSLRLVPGFHTFIHKMKKKYHLAVVTSNQPDILKKLIDQFDLQNVFERVTTSYDNPDPALAKPHPFMVQQTLHAFSCSPDEAVVIGDAVSDVEMALAAGVEPVAVLTGHLTREKAEAMSVKKIIADVTKLESIL